MSRSAANPVACVSKIRGRKYAGIFPCLAIAVLLASMTCVTPAEAQVAASTSPSEPAAKALPGTLFFSREQREKMDRTRLLGAASTDDDSAAMIERQSVLNGFVKRSDGRTMVWVDGQAKYDVKGGAAENLVPMDVGGPTTGIQTARLDQAVNQLKTRHAKKAVSKKTKGTLSAPNGKRATPKSVRLKIRPAAR